MAKWFNIGGPCRAVDHYMLSATERLPNVVQKLIAIQQDGKDWRNRCLFCIARG